MKLLSLAVTAAMLTITAAPSYAQNYVTKEEFGAMVKDYLMQNPEVMIEALEQYQQKAQTEGLKKTKEAIALNSKQLYENPNHPAVGKKDASVTIVEFFDYNCSACKYAFKPLDALREKDKDVRIIFVEYPIFGEQSEKLAKIGLAVNALKPDAYYAFHKLMMEHKGSITPEQAFAYAEKAGVNRTKLEKELENNAYNKMLAGNKLLGDNLMLRGTPFLIVGGEPVPHALDEAGLAKYMEEARTKK